MKKEKYLIVNAGSSSLKFQLYEIDENGNEKVIAKGGFERIGAVNCSWKLTFNGTTIKNSHLINNHVEAVKEMLIMFAENHICNINEISGVGHRILHGGNFYKDSVLIDDSVIANIDSLKALGPLHIPSQLACVNCFRALLPEVPEVAIFDTAFHQTIPAINYLERVPLEWLKLGVRKYGFHGSSYKYITQYMQNLLKKQDVNLIICHIGSGASVCAVKNGKSFITTMGITPLSGVMMGTRSGTVDPAIFDYMKEKADMSSEMVTEALNKKSGLLGISGKNDYRDVEAAALAGDERAKMAIGLLVKSVIESICKYYNKLEYVDGIIFTAGIGENAFGFREKVIKGYDFMFEGELQELAGIEKSCSIGYDQDANRSIASYLDVHEGEITNEYTNTRVYVIPTDEELMMVRDTYRIVKENELEKSKGFVLTR